MRWLGWGGGVVVVLVAMGAIYAWGAGLFWPCEALGRGNGNCERILSLDGRQISAMTLLPDGAVLAVTRGSGPFPETGQELATIDAETGAIISQIALDVLAPEASVSGIAVNGDATRVALSVLNEDTQVIDRSGNPVAAFSPSLPAFFGFDAEGRVLMRRLGNEYGLDPAQEILAYDPATPDAEPVAVDIAAAGTILSAGLNLAFSPDGTLFAQALPALRGRGVAGLRAGLVERPDVSGLLLATRVPEDCSPTFVDIGFSPGGGRIAATFECNHRWGNEGSKLAAWDINAGHLLADMSATDWWGDFLWIDEATLVVERYNGDTHLGELFRITLD